MINQIKNIIIENKKVFHIDNFFENDLKVSKFFHGNPTTNTKVLFFISIHNKPLCIIKMSRNLNFNNIIEREVEGIRYFDSKEFGVPKLFFEGEFKGLKYLCQEVISGSPVGEEGKNEVFDFVAGYHNSIKRTKKIKISVILDAIKHLEIKNDKEYDEVFRMLDGRKEHEIYVVAQHGDLTHKNLMESDKGIVFIDFENFGLRSFWGSDITHYLARMTDVYDKYRENKSVLETSNYFVKITKGYREKLNISDEESVDLFLLDLLFEDLQKTYSTKLKEIIPIMKNLWLE